MSAPRVCLIPLLLTGTSCGRSAIEGGFEAPVPAAKLHASSAAARSGDEAAVKNLIEQLDSDDPAVRLAAIEALRKLTGEDRGYDHAAEPAARRRAINDWVQSTRPANAGSTAAISSPPPEVVDE